MEAFSLLKYWRGNGGGGGGGLGVVAGDSGLKMCTAAGTTTIVTAVENQDNEIDDDVGDDDGPFFDLEFAVPVEEDGDGEQSIVNGEKEDENEGAESTESEDGESEFKFTLSSGSNGDDRTEQSTVISPSDDMFIKGTLVPVETSEESLKPQFPVSLMKSATKFRVFMLGLKKSKSTTAAAEKIEQTRSVSVSASTSPKQQQKQDSESKTEQKQQHKPESELKQQESKFFTIKFKVDEVPIVSLFTRDASRSSSATTKLNKQSSDESAAVMDEKRFSKEVVQKYLKKVKPLYIRVSKRYGEKLKFSGQLSLNPGVKTLLPAKSTVVQSESEEEVNTNEAQANDAKSQKQGNLPAGMIVRKHLGKSKSASAAVAAAPVSTKRRDDSLLQQQDGIQSAILHCKRSFNASRDSDSNLSRSASDSSNENQIKERKGQESTS